MRDDTDASHSKTLGCRCGLVVVGGGNGYQQLWPFRYCCFVLAPRFSTSPDWPQAETHKGIINKPCKDICVSSRRLEQMTGRHLCTFQSKKVPGGGRVVWSVTQSTFAQDTWVHVLFQRVISHFLNSTKCVLCLKSLIFSITWPPSFFFAFGFA